MRCDEQEFTPSPLLTGRRFALVVNFHIPFINRYLHNVFPVFAFKFL